MITVSPLVTSPGLYGIHSPAFSPKLRDACRSIPGMRWEAPQWVGYRDAVSLVVDELQAKGLYIEDMPASAPLRNGVKPSVAKAAVKDLRDYQALGVRFLLEHAAEGALLADDLGLGKSGQLLRTMRALGMPALVVCLASGRSVWGASESSEVKRWWPEAWPPRVLAGTQPVAKVQHCNRGACLMRCGCAGTCCKPLPPSLPAVPLTVCHYDILHAWAPLLAGIPVVAFDEIHSLQSEKSRRSGAAREVARAASYRMGASGTPMTNRPKDLWNVCDVLSEGRFGNFFQYCMRYADAHKEQVTETKAAWIFDGASNLEELKKRLASFMLRRTKSDVSIELPERTRQIIEVDIPLKRQVSISDALTDNASLRRALEYAADGKLPQVCDLAQEHAEAGHHVIIWCHRRSIAEDIAERLGAVFVHGGQPLAERQRTAELHPKILCATMDSVGTGVNFLSYADIGIFAELDWQPHKLVQCEGRQHRSGAKRAVLFQYVIAAGTADEVVRKVVLKKMQAFEEGVGALDDGLRSDLGKDVSEAAQLKKMYERLLKQDEEGD